MGKHSYIHRPDGTIMQNGARAQEFENVELNQETYDMYLRRLASIAISVFEWKGLPEGIDQRMLEWWLIRDGYVVLFKDESLKADPKARAPEGYAVLPCMIRGQFDNYSYPMERTAYAVNGTNIELTEENSVLIFNNQLRMPMWCDLELYAHRLTNFDRSIDVNVMMQKTPRVIRCTDKQRLTFKNLMMQVAGNVYNIFADKSIDLNDIQVFDTTAPFVTPDLQTSKGRLWNEALTYLGVENSDTEKKERLITSEVLTSMGDVEAQRFTRLVPRLKACEDAKNLFGLDIDCFYRSGSYVKADGYGAQYISTNGMQDGTVSLSGNSGYKNE